MLVSFEKKFIRGVKKQCKKGDANLINFISKDTDISMYHASLEYFQV